MFHLMFSQTVETVKNLLTLRENPLIFSEKSNYLNLKIFSPYVKILSPYVKNPLTFSNFFHNFQVIEAS